MDKYCFYFDESFHDRKITNIKNKGLNIHSKDKSDIFIGAFVGIEKDQINKFEDDFFEFEQIYKKKFTIEDDKELKAVNVIKKRNFEFGFGSFNKNTISFYSDYFDILNNYNFKFQINFKSKSEFLVEKVFENINFNIFGVKRVAFIYSIIKFMTMYRAYGIQNKLLNNNNLTSEDIIDSLISTLIDIMEKINGIERKKQELNAIKESLMILSNIRLNIRKYEKITWDYTHIFEGLRLFLEESNLEKSQIEIFLDKEGTEEILKAGKSLNSKYIIDNYDSEEISGIRVADILSNFFGRLIYSVQETLREDTSKNIKKDRVLVSTEWFEITEEKFKLIKKIGTLFDKQIYYSTYSSIYDDNIFVLFYYIHYINSYQKYEEYRKVKNHYEIGNNIIIYKFQEYLKNKF